MESQLRVMIQIHKFCMLWTLISLWIYLIEQFIQISIKQMAMHNCRSLLVWTTYIIVFKHYVIYKSLSVSTCSKSYPYQRCNLLWTNYGPELSWCYKQSLLHMWISILMQFFFGWRIYYYKWFMKFYISCLVGTLYCFYFYIQYVSISTCKTNPNSDVMYSEFHFKSKQSMVQNY